VVGYGVVRGVPRWCLCVASRHLVCHHHHLHQPLTSPAAAHIEEATKVEEESHLEEASDVEGERDVRGGEQRKVSSRGQGESN